MVGKANKCPFRRTRPKYQTSPSSKESIHLNHINVGVNAKRKKLLFDSPEKGEDEKSSDRSEKTIFFFK